jgi:hypothetical protein
VVLCLLFWLFGRSPRTHYYGPVILSDGARTALDNDYGDVYLSAQDDDDCTSDDYRESSSTANERDV